MNQELKEQTGIEKSQQREDVQSFMTFFANIAEELKIGN